MAVVASFGYIWEFRLFLFKIKICDWVGGNVVFWGRMFDFLDLKNVYLDRRKWVVW